MSASAAEFYYVDKANQRQGPVGENDIFRMVGDGEIVAETLLWTNGMSDWRRADSFDRFGPLFERTMIMPPSSAMPPAPPARQPAKPQPADWSRAPATAPAQTWSSPGPTSHGGAVSGPSGALVPTLPVWGLFGRAILMALGSIFIVPAPWTSTMFYGFIYDHVALPDGRRFRFTGQPLDIWWVFIVIGLAGWLRVIPFGGLLGFLVTAALTVLILRWLCQKLETDRGPLNLSFEGQFLPYVGWNVLLILSCITIIGWAWVVPYMMRWICQNVRGSLGFEFHGTAVEILWRGVVLVLGSMFVIPIPWLMRWYANWFISQVHVVPARA